MPVVSGAGGLPFRATIRATGFPVMYAYARERRADQDPGSLVRGRRRRRLIGLPDAEPFPLLDRVPPALRGVILEVAWDVDLLRQLDLPVVDVELADLRWQLELPWWTHEGHPFAISPTQVRADPARYPGTGSASSMPTSIARST